VPDSDYFEACELTDLMGVKAIEMLKKAKGGGGSPPSGMNKDAAAAEIQSGVQAYLKKKHEDQAKDAAAGEIQAGAQAYLQKIRSEKQVATSLKLTLGPFKEEFVTLELDYSAAFKAGGIARSSAVSSSSSKPAVSSKPVPPPPSVFNNESAAAAAKIQAMQRGKSSRKVPPAAPKPKGGAKEVGFGGWMPPDKAAAKIQAIQRGKSTRSVAAKAK